MGTKKRILEYMDKNFTEVMHTTLNPEGPGVVRIHLIPPVKDDNGEISSSVAIINGQDIIPVNFSWTILLCECIKEVNKYSGKPITESESEMILSNTVRAVRKVFPLLSKNLIKSDLYTIMRTFTQVARGEKPDEEIGYISLADYAPYMGAPHRMDILVSSMIKDEKWNCNQNCLHCYAAGQESGNEKELGTDDLKKIIDKLREACIPQITFTGGEPTMRDDLPELLEYSKWFVTRLNTNGIRLTKEYCEKLSEVSLDSVQITFYSSDEKIHNELVGRDAYADTLCGMENAIGAGLSVSINTPLCTLNKDYVNTLKFLKQKGIIYVTCSGLIMTGNALNDNSKAMSLTEDEIKNIVSDAKKFCDDNGMEISFTSPGWIDEEFFTEHKMQKPACGACLSNMALTPSGNVVPCQSYLSGEPLGNMLSDSWDKIWNSEECKKHREFSSLMNGKCPLKLMYEKDNAKEAGHE